MAPQQWIPTSKAPRAALLAKARAAHATSVCGGPANGGISGRNVGRLAAFSAAMRRVRTAANEASAPVPQFTYAQMYDEEAAELRAYERGEV